MTSRGKTANGEIHHTGPATIHWVLATGHPAGPASRPAPRSTVCQTSAKRSWVRASLTKSNLNVKHPYFMASLTCRAQRPYPLRSCGFDDPSYPTKPSLDRPTLLYRLQGPTIFPCTHLHLDIPANIPLHSPNHHATTLVTSALTA